MFFEQLLFFVAGFGALAGALGVVILRNPFYSVLALVAHLLSLSVLFLLLHAEFIAAGQVVVYAGAVMVLYVFVVAYVGSEDQTLRPPSGTATLFGPLFAAVMLIEITIAVVGSGLESLGSTGPKVGDTFGTPAQIGELLLNQFLVPFEAASFLLLLAAVAAVVLARKRRGLDDPAPSPNAIAPRESFGRGKVSPDAPRHSY